MNWKLILEFIIHYWSEIVYITCAVFALIIAFCKKRGKTDPAIEGVLSSLPFMICKAEQLYSREKNGSVKKDFVLMCALDLYEQFTGIKLTKDSKIAQHFGDAIENILSTPQKKEEK